MRALFHGGPWDGLQEVLDDREHWDAPVIVHRDPVVLAKGTYTRVIEREPFGTRYRPVWPPAYVWRPPADIEAVVHSVIYPNCPRIDVHEHEVLGHHGGTHALATGDAGEHW